MEFLNEVWDTLKEIAESKMNEIFAGHKDNKGQLDYGRFETFFQKMFKEQCQRLDLLSQHPVRFYLYITRIYHFYVKPIIYTA